MAVRLIAYTIDMMTDAQMDWVIEPAPARREWMEQTVMKTALRCLPLNLANQAGWIVRCPATFKAVWKDRTRHEQSALTITFTSKADEQFAGMIKSNFGSGVVTFVLPWLFRTSEGIGLWVRGPANTPLQDVSPLEGLVETDWSPYPFTMNWKITRPKVDVWFRKGDPICMLTPFPLALLETVEPRVLPLQSHRETYENFMEAVSRRHNQHRDHPGSDPDVFELSYMRGFTPMGQKAPEHRTNLRLAPFV